MARERAAETARTAQSGRRGAAVLLVEAIETLVDRGAQHTKMLLKLRDVAQFQATWAELRCAAVIARNSDSDIRVELDAGRASGEHADLRLLVADANEHAPVRVTPFAVRLLAAAAH